MASIQTFIAGYCTHRACMAVRGASLNQICQFPAQCVLITSGDKLWLWDTGYSAHFFDATAHGSYALYPKVTPVFFTPEQAMRAQLAKIGIAKSDLHAIVISHFHADHIAGLKDFDGTPFIASRASVHALRGLKGISAVRQGFLPDVMPDDFGDRVQFIDDFPQVALPSELAPFTHGFTLPDSDDDIYAVLLDGHAAGHIGLFVHTDNGWVLLAGDSAWSHLNYQGRPPSRLVHPLLSNVQAYYRTLDKLQQLHQNGIAIHLSHEVFGTSILEHTLSDASGASNHTLSHD